MKQIMVGVGSFSVGGILINETPNIAIAQDRLVLLDEKLNAIKYLDLGNHRYISIVVSGSKMTNKGKADYNRFRLFNNLNRRKLEELSENVICSTSSDGESCMILILEK